ncbi:MAG: hypothetical protein NZ930_04430 [Candidatus Bipolaricaulota bacterium]|nr:hypothetical protein [Candidatus Bipolaricaulota bacterium]MDW8030557.1 hypothetical protein [Candidatus Bipolaricaulota bacterium]
MRTSKVILLCVIMIALGSHWLLLPHWFLNVSVHPEHNAHDHPASDTIALLQHHCCEQAGDALSAHRSLCCGACPALPGAIADFCFDIPYRGFIAIEPLAKDLLVPESLWHPPTL